MRFRLGLFAAAELTEREVRAVLTTLRVRSLTERLDTLFFTVSVAGAELRCEPTDPHLVQLLQALFDSPPPTATREDAQAAELCVLVPGAKNRDYQVARRVPDVPGWAFKDLDTAVSELDGASPALLSSLRRASNLGVAVVFGVRQRKSGFENTEDLEELDLDP